MAGYLGFFSIRHPEMSQKGINQTQLIFKTNTRLQKSLKLLIIYTLFDNQ